MNIKSFKINTLIALSSLLFLGACSVATIDSADVKSSAISRYYSLKYSEKDEQLEAFADFNAGGSTGSHVKLSNPAKVLFNGGTMREGDAWGTSYFNQRKLKKQIFDADGTFTSSFAYTNSDGVSAESVATIQKVEVISPALAVKGKPFTLVYSVAGKPIPGATVIATLTQSPVDDKHPSILESAQSVVKKTFAPIKFSADQMKHFRKDKVTLEVTLESVQHSSDEASKLGITVRTVYETPTLELTIN